MRAATAIVGAIAVASILIALSFIVSGDSSSPEAATKTVTEIVQARPPTNEAAADEEGATEPEGGEATTHFGGPAQCNGGEFTVEDVSCEIGVQIRERHAEGESGSLLAQTPSETISMTCTGTAPVECKGPGGARVYFEK
ncbi:MAG: hypothetical protein QOH18_1112 [Solirubrobacterales bacterium]|jgi:hypothetical protein|nr:hypothetical protein [Solirubrobacterales bacterium]